LIGLMAVTAIRVGEAIGLGRDDVDRPGQQIRVIDGKFGKSREVAVHETTIAALDSYAEVLDRVCPRGVMGHVTPASTYYYLTAAPDLLALVARRLEATPERTSDEQPGTHA
jgi:integrase